MYVKEMKCMRTKMDVKGMFLVVAAIVVANKVASPLWDNTVGKFLN